MDWKATKCLDLCPDTSKAGISQFVKVTQKVNRREALQRITKYAETATDQQSKVRRPGGYFKQKEIMMCPTEDRLGITGPSHTWLRGYGRFPEKALSCCPLARGSLRGDSAATQNPRGGRGWPQPARPRPIRHRPQAEAGSGGEGAVMGGRGGSAPPPSRRSRAGTRGGPRAALPPRARPSRHSPPAGSLRARAARPRPRPPRRARAAPAGDRAPPSGRAGPGGAPGPAPSGPGPERAGEWRVWRRVGQGRHGRELGTQTASGTRPGRPGEHRHPSSQTESVQESPVLPCTAAHRAKLVFYSWVSCPGFPFLFSISRLERAPFLAYKRKSSWFLDAFKT